MTNDDVNIKKTGLIYLKKRKKADCRKIYNVILPHTPLNRDHFIQTKINLAHPFDSNLLYDFMISGKDPDHNRIYLFFKSREISTKARQYLQKLSTKSIWVRGIFRVSANDPKVFMNQEGLKIFTDNKPICGRNENDR